MKNSYDARHHNYKETKIAEGASQSAEYDIDDYAVFMLQIRAKQKKVLSHWYRR